MRTPADEFTRARWLRYLELMLNGFLGLTLLLGLNYWSLRHYIRVDITRGQQYSLSPETLAYLKRLERPLNIIATVSKRSPRERSSKLFTDMENLFRAYVYAVRPYITVEFVDIFRQPKRTQEIASRYGLEEEDVILVISGDRSRQFAATDLYEMKEGQRYAFRGEQVITSAILTVSNPDSPKIYWSVGHGEMELDDVDSDRGLSELAQLLQERNLVWKRLDLSLHHGVPQDAALVVIAGPHVPLLPQEVEKLRMYLSEQNGRLAVFVSPRDRHGLDTLFDDWGLLVEERFVVQPRVGEQTSEALFIIRDFASHPLTQSHIDQRLTVLVGACRPVLMYPDTPSDDHRSLTTLMATDETSWAKRSYPSRNESDSFDPKVDIRGPISIAVASERKIDFQLGLKIPRSRLIVFGNTDFITNQHLNVLGNRMLVLNTLNWSLDRETLLNIPPRRIEPFHITLSQNEIWKLALVLVIGLPIAIGCVGGMVFWFRNR